MKKVECEKCGDSVEFLNSHSYCINGVSNLFRCDPCHKKTYITVPYQPERSKREDPKGMRCSEHSGN
jgi:hypothetical protein